MCSWLRWAAKVYRVTTGVQVIRNDKQRSTELEAEAVHHQTAYEANDNIVVSYSMQLSTWFNPYNIHVVKGTGCF